jgi:sec-independent protein translocase protein TatB
MNFFNIGTAELLLIFVVALIVVGPRRLPEIARTLGKIVTDVRKMSQDFTTEMTRELEAPAEELAEVKRELEAPVKELTEMTRELETPAKEPKESADQDTSEKEESTNEDQS